MFKIRRRGRLSVAALVVAVAATSLAVPAAFATGTVSARNIIPAAFADPDVLVDGGTYYAYASKTSAYKVPVATATNPEGPWTVQSEGALKRYPTWAVDTGDDAAMWAPDVSKRPDGTYLMLFTANDEAKNLMCIATATSTSPLKGFVPDDSGPLICPLDNPDKPNDRNNLHGAIDASTFTDSDGRHYILYKNNGNGLVVGRTSEGDKITAYTKLWIQEVDAAGTTLIGKPTKLLQDEGEDDAGIIEAPVLVKHDNEYVLFFSTGDWKRTYGVKAYSTAYARADSLLGPYTRNSRKLLAGPPESDMKNPITQDVLGPGGADVVGNKIYFHGRSDVGETRTFWVSDLGWSNGGRPVVRGSRFRYEPENQPKSSTDLVKNKEGASGGKVVGNISSANDWVEINVTAPVAGSYTMRVGYYAGWGAAKHNLTINGLPPREVNYPDTGSWTTRKQVNVDIELTEGINKVRFNGIAGYYADIDYVDVS